MKKTFMIALAGMMLFAFTQCGGGSADGKKNGNKTKANGGKGNTEATSQDNQKNAGNNGNDGVTGKFVAAEGNDEKKNAETAEDNKKPENTEATEANNGSENTETTESNNGSENTESNSGSGTAGVTGTKEYRDSVEAIAQMTAILDKVKTCEDYNNSRAKWEAISNEMDRRIPLYTEEERMTKEEQDDVRERALEFFKRTDKISRALCK